jgi:hypothetical protein
VGCGLSKAHIRPEVLVPHGNARTTVHGRKLIAVRHRAGWKQAHIAAAMGISRTCVRTWITRFEAEGEAGLVDDVEDLGTAEAGDLYGSHAGGATGSFGRPRHGVRTQRDAAALTARFGGRHAFGVAVTWRAAVGKRSVLRRGARTP